MNNGAIHKALARRLEQVANTLLVPVAWENTPFTPPTSGIYLEENFLPAETEDVFVQGTKAIRRGVYQVTVVYPLAKGTQAAAALADKIAEEFPNNAIIDTTNPALFVNGFSDVFTGISDDRAYRVPVSIPYMITA